jgi:hypothetical protein
MTEPELNQPAEPTIVRAAPAEPGHFNPAEPLKIQLPSSLVAVAAKLPTDFIQH